MKTLALALLEQIIIILPNPPAKVMKEIQYIFYKFLLNGKPDKIKGNVIVNSYEEGDHNCHILILSVRFYKRDASNEPLPEK